MRLAEEYFDIVDENDRVIGRKSDSDCLKHGLLHRAVVVFLRDSGGRVYLQKRSNSMRWYPGTWSASCTGHVSSGETHLEGAKREVREELGLDKDLLYVGEFLSPKWKYKDIVEWEYIRVFEGKVVNAKIVHNEEVAGGRWVDYSELKRMVQNNPDGLTPDTLLAFREYSRYIEK